MLAATWIHFNKSSIAKVFQVQLPMLWACWKVECLAYVSQLFFCGYNYIKLQFLRLQNGVSGDDFFSLRTYLEQPEKVLVG